MFRLTFKTRDLAQMYLSGLIILGTPQIPMDATLTGHMPTSNNFDQSNWRDAILRIWRNHSGRVATSSDINCFRLILDAPEAFIRGQLADSTNYHPPPPPAPPQVSQAYKGLPILDHASCLQLFETSQRTDGVIVPPHLQQATPPSTQAPNDVPQQTSNDILTSKSLPLRPHHAEPAVTVSPQIIASQILPKLPREPRWGPVGMPIPPSTLAAIKDDIHSRQQNVCKNFAHQSGPKGSYPCTLSCGRWFASSCDRRRHEETVFPREYWVCYDCSSGQTSRKRFQFFHRLDKIQKHNREKHDDQLDINDCKIRDPPVLTPASCGLCQHAFAHRADRDDHIEACHGGRKQQAPTGLTKPEPSRALGGQPTNVHRPSVDAVVSRPVRLVQQQSPSQSMVTLHRLVADSTKPSKAPTEHLIAVQWSGEAIARCGVAVTRRAEIAFDMHRGHAAEPRTYVVKQYPHQNRTMYEQEFAAFSLIAAQSHKGGMTKCFGVFHDIDSEDMPTYNIILDCSQYSLWRYWTGSDPPRAFVSIQSFYAELFSLAIGLESLEGLRKIADQSAECMFQGDFRPENIHAFPQPQAELAHKLRFDMLCQPCTVARPGGRPGRRAWRRVVIVLTCFGCGSKLNLICTAASSEVGYGMFPPRHLRPGANDCRARKHRRLSRKGTQGGSPSVQLRSCASSHLGRLRQCWPSHT